MMVPSLFNMVLCFHAVAALSDRLEAPDFTSEWLYLQAQSNPNAFLNVTHGLGVVPDLVEVLVMAVDGLNENFIFKAMGNGGREDDFSDTYGAVVYIYNHESVLVLAPNGISGAVHFQLGGAVYTGEPPYWTGVNSQWSDKAYIQVRCWLPTSLPPPCFQSSGTPITPGQDTSSVTYIEIPHGLGRYPDLVKVRANFTEGSRNGWYSDAQGSVTGVHRTKTKHSSGGLKFGYNDDAIRIWASSDEAYLFSAIDGWGYRTSFQAKRGELDIFAWCDLGLTTVYEKTMRIGPSVVNEELELTMPTYIALGGDIEVSLLAKVETGPNAGFVFEGVGSAKGNNYNYTSLGNLCKYGGVIYAYSRSTIRLWRPMDTSGSAVCINEEFGNGINVQAAETVTVIINVRQRNPLVVIPTSYTAPVLQCQHFYRVSEHLSYNSSLDFMMSAYAMSPMACHSMCQNYGNCTTFVYQQYMCQLYSAFDITSLYQELNSEVWTVGS